jgi:hypothetical protein
VCSSWGVPPILLTSAFTRPAKGDVALTCNLPPSELAYLLSDEHGKCFWSNDEDVLPGEDAGENVRRVFTALGLDSRTQFTSLAAQSGADNSNICKTLRSYGNATLVIDPGLLGSEEVVIMNGDVKDLGAKVEETGDSTWAERVSGHGGIAALASRLEKLVSNARQGKRPRRVGSYFEARLLRALTPNDIVALHLSVPNEYAKRLCGQETTPPVPQ